MYHKRQSTVGKTIIDIAKLTDIISEAFMNMPVVTDNTVFEAIMNMTIITDITVLEAIPGRLIVTHPLRSS
jgi:hypothetical protein